MQVPLACLYYGVNMKHCNKCDTTKPFDEFYNNNSSKDRLQCVCKKCANRYTEQWRRENLAKKRRAKPKNFKTIEKEIKQKREKLNRRAVVRRNNKKREAEIRARWNKLTLDGKTTYGDLWLRMNPSKTKEDIFPAEKNEK